LPARNESWALRCFLFTKITTPTTRWSHTNEDESPQRSILARPTRIGRKCNTPHRRTGPAAAYTAEKIAQRYGRKRRRCSTSDVRARRARAPTDDSRFIDLEGGRGRRRARRRSATVAAMASRRAPPAAPSVFAMTSISDDSRQPRRYCVVSMASENPPKASSVVAHRHAAETARPRKYA
jgi:hypothetical protein